MANIQPRVMRPVRVSHTTGHSCREWLRAGTTGFLFSNSTLARCAWPAASFGRRSRRCFLNRLAQTQKLAILDNVAASETPSWSLRAASMADLSCCSMQVSKSLTRCRNEARLGSNEQGRQADYDRLTALPLGAELGDVGCSAFDVSRWPRTCNGPRGLSLMAALQVNSGTAKEDARRKPRLASVRCANT